MVSMLSKERKINCSPELRGKTAQPEGRFSTIKKNLFMNSLLFSLGIFLNKTGIKLGECISILIHMKTNYFQIILFCLTWIISSTARGQSYYELPAEHHQYDEANYSTGVGIRLGSGLTVKQFVNPITAIEGILGYSYNTLLLSG